MMALPAYCPVCHQSRVRHWSTAKDVEYFSSQAEYHYFECTDCGSIFIDPVPADQLRVIYPSNYYSFVPAKGNPVLRIKEWLDKLFLKKILQQLPAGPVRVLDIGGGTGRIPDLLRKSSRRVTDIQVVDIDPDAKAPVEEKGYSYFEGTIEQFETGKRFELVLMLNLLEHVADPKAVLQKAGSLLAPGGIIVIKTPNTRSWDARLFRKTYWGGLHCPRHWIIFSAESFRILLEGTGLTLRQLKYTQGAPFWAFSIIVALHRKKWVRVSAAKPVIYHWLFAPLSACFALFDFLRRPFAKTSQLFITVVKQEEGGAVV